MDQFSDPKFKIAYWLTDKKKSKLKIDLIEQQLKRDGYQLIRIQNPDDFETKGPFSVFCMYLKSQVYFFVTFHQLELTRSISLQVHKLTDITINFNLKTSNHSTTRPQDKETEKWIQKYKVSF